MKARKHGATCFCIARRTHHVNAKRVKETSKELGKLECCQVPCERGLVTKRGCQKVSVPVEGRNEVAAHGHNEIAAFFRLIPTVDFQ